MLGPPLGMLPVSLGYVMIEFLGALGELKG